ncbi:MAG: hypothetical protein LBE81_04425 [Azonexus sp.]|jgi:hypothetical protein|uniref:hypothetical protein n=1 Tax=Azonexus sp. TaxID=1872668 RepID=UPI0028364807|nr:hypothetical protein [Azonexus sp.]MDR0775865.1 hypothetical protein [Azonexus sp.]
MPGLRKSNSHGKIGEAAVYAKCWMHGIPAYFTGGLRNNFAGSDLIVETKSQRAKLWVQVKTGAPILKDHVYLTQCAGDRDLDVPKFESDFVVFVNLDTHPALKHTHAGELGFEHLSFYIVPAEDANSLYLRELVHWHNKPKRDGGVRKLGNMAVHISASEMARYRDAWSLLKARSAA